MTGLRGMPGVMGGVEAHCEELLPRVAAKAPDLEIEVIARRPYLRSSTRVGDVRVTPLPSTRGRSSEAITSTFAGVMYARRRGASVVHIHAIGPALLAPLARAVGMRVVVTHHGADYQREKWGLVAKSVLRLGEQLAVRFADALIVVAPSLAEALKKRVPAHAAKIHYVPNGTTGFPPSSSDDSVLKSLRLRPNNYILAVGRLVPEKEFHTLIAALRRSKQNRKLVIVGGADHESRYSRWLRQQAANDVVFAGVQKRSALQQLYEHAAVVVLPSSHEGLPIAALEAGSLGCPILLSDIVPNRDLGLPDANYFPVGDEVALAERLEGSFGSLAVSPRIFDEFDWDLVSDQTLRIYRRVLAHQSATLPMFRRRRT